MHACDEIGVAEWCISMLMMTYALNWNAVKLCTQSLKLIIQS